MFLVILLIGVLVGDVATAATAAVIFCLLPSLLKGVQGGLYSPDDGEADEHPSVRGSR